MKRKKIVITLLTVLAVLFVMIEKSFATNSYSASLTPNNSKVSKGSEVQVTFKISGISFDEGDGINAITSTLKFDSDVLTLTKTEGLNGWVLEFNEDTNKMTIDSSEATSEDTEIAKFTFKVDSNTSATTAAVQMVSIAAGNSSLSEEVKISDITTNISIGSSSLSPSTSTSASASTSTSTSPSTSASTSPTTSASASASPSATSNSTTTKNESMPNTGAETYVLPLMAIIAILGVVSFVNYRRIGKK